MSDTDAINNNTDVTNMALGRLGITGVTDYNTDTTASGVESRKFLNGSRAFVLGARNWTFATEIRRLLKRNAPPSRQVWDVGYGNTYYSFPDEGMVLSQAQLDAGWEPDRYYYSLGVDDRLGFNGPFPNIPDIPTILDSYSLNVSFDLILTNPANINFNVPDVCRFYSFTNSNTLWVVFNGEAAINTGLTLIADGVTINRVVFIMYGDGTFFITPDAGGTSYIGAYILTPSRDGSQVFMYSILTDVNDPSARGMTIIDDYSLTITALVGYSFGTHEFLDNGAGTRIYRTRWNIIGSSDSADRPWFTLWNAGVADPLGQTEEDLAGRWIRTNDWRVIRIQRLFTNPSCKPEYAITNWNQRTNQVILRDEDKWDIYAMVTVDPADKVFNVNHGDPLFYQLWVLHLAIQMCITLTENEKLLVELWKEYYSLLPDAVSLNAGQGDVDVINSSNARLTSIRRT